MRFAVCRYWLAHYQAPARRLPGNAIGWLLGLIGLLVAAEMLTEQYTVYGLVTAPGSVPGARLAGWFSTVMIEMALFLLLFLLLLFPDGRLPSRRWRPVLWASARIACAHAVTSVTFPRKRLVQNFTSRLRGDALS